MEEGSVVNEASEPTEQRLDWDKAQLHPKTAEGFILVVDGVAPVPMKVRLHSLPIGIAPEDYHEVEVVGRAADVSPQVETPWKAEIDTEGLSGRKGFVLIGETKREYFPPKDS
jgi:hypothetical protein